VEYFKPSDFECRCDSKNCDAVPIDQELVENLIKLRKMVGMPFIITSGSRCRYWNEKKNGSPDSYHLTGQAVDFRVSGGAFVYMVAKLAPSFGFFGIGINKGFIHLDRRKASTPVMFGY